jgi:hypothetical protein
MDAALRLPGLGNEKLNRGLLDDWIWVALIGRLVSTAISAVAEPADADRSGATMEELQLGSILAGVFGDLGLDDGAAWRLVAVIRMLGHLPLPSSVTGLAAAERAPAIVRALVADESVRPYIRVNVWEGVSWFNRESFGNILWWMLALDAVEAMGSEHGMPARVSQRLKATDRVTTTLAGAARDCGYQLDKLEAATKG